MTTFKLKMRQVSDAEVTVARGQHSREYNVISFQISLRLCLPTRRHHFHPCSETVVDNDKRYTSSRRHRIFTPPKFANVGRTMNVNEQRSSAFSRGWKNHLLILKILFIDYATLLAIKVSAFFLLWHPRADREGFLITSRAKCVISKNWIILPE